MGFNDGDFQTVEIQRLKAIGNGVARHFSVDWGWQVNSLWDSRERNKRTGCRAA